MLISRTNLNRLFMALGALLFLFVSVATQACVLSDHENIVPATSLSPHLQKISAPSSVVSVVASAHDDDCCCHLIIANVNETSSLRDGGGVTSQDPVAWWQSHAFATAFISSRPTFTLALHETTLVFNHVAVPPSRLSINRFSSRAPPALRS